MYRWYTSTMKIDFVSLPSIHFLFFLLHVKTLRLCECLAKHDIWEAMQFLSSFQLNCSAHLICIYTFYECKCHGSTFCILLTFLSISTLSSNRTDAGRDSSYSSTQTIQFLPSYPALTALSILQSVLCQNKVQNQCYELSY